MLVTQFKTALSTNIYTTTQSTHFIIPYHLLNFQTLFYYSQQLFTIHIKTNLSNNIKTMEQSDIQMTLRNNKRVRLTDETADTTDYSESDNEETKNQPKLGRKLQFKRSDAKITKERKKFSWPVYKKLLKYAAKQWKLFMVSIFFLLVSAFFTSSMPYIIGILLDKIAHPDQNGNSETVQRSTSASHWHFLIFLVLLSVSTYFRTVTTQILQQRIAISLRTDVFSSFITNDIYFFQLYKSGELNSRVGNDINQAKSAISNNITFLLRSILTTIFNICVLIFMSWKLSLMVLALVPLYMIITSIHNRKTKMLVKQYQDVQAETAVHLNEVFTGIQVVKAFSTQQKQMEKYYSIQTKGYSINYLKAVYAGFYMTASLFIPNIGILMIIWYGGSLVMSGKSDLTAGELTSFIMYCMTVSRQASSISNGYNNIINGTGAVQKVFSMMEYQPFIDEKQQKKFPTYKLKGQIQFQNVTFKYPKGDIQVIRNLNLHISPGQYVAFVGQSGSGKSTIVKLIERFYEIQSGTLSYDGVDSKNMNIKNIRDQCGFVSQQAILFSGTIQENITYGVQDYSYNQMIDACEQSGCIQFIMNQKLFPDGFKTTVGQKGNQLSGGQRQRISIARALMRKPKILIFDEATSALDSNSEYIVQKSIQNLVSNKKFVMTIIIIAHRLSTIIGAQKIYVMKSGQVVQSGNHDFLISKNGYYSELFAKQIQGVSSMTNIEIPENQSS